MATVKLVLRKKKNKDNTYPLAIRITKDRKSSFIHVGHHIRSEDWDGVAQRVRKSHPNSARLNNLLLKKLTEATDKSLELEANTNTVSAKSVKSKIKNAKGASFFQQAEIYIEDLTKSGKYNCVKADKPRIKHFREFLGGEDIGFTDITVTMLNRFRAYLKGTRNIGEITIINHLVVIRSIFSQAMKAGLVNDKYYPFGPGKINIHRPETAKMGLSIDEVRRIEGLQLEDYPKLRHCRNLWLLSFYFAGMRYSDVLRLRWSDFKDGRLYYKMGKNEKAGSLKVPEKVLAILAEYEASRRNANDLVFPELKGLKDFSDLYEIQKKIAYENRTVTNGLKRIGKLAEIEKKLTMHIARHSFGNISGDRIPVQMLQKLYRHSSINTTIGYQANFIHKDADDALDAVVSF